MVKKWINSLNGIRVLALIIVTTYHLFSQKISGGFLAVQLFFLLSGFLLTISLIDKDISLSQHISKRFVRLFLPLLLMVCSVIFIAYWLVEDVKYGIRKDGLMSLLFSNNYYQLSLGRSYFERWSNKSPFTHLYSLSIEAHFSLLWPVIFLFFNRCKLSFKQKFSATSLILALSIGYSFYFMFHIGDITQFYYRTETRIFGLVAGALCAFIVKWINDKRLPFTSSFLNGVEVSTLIGMFILFFTAKETEPVAYFFTIHLFTVLAMIHIISLTQEKTVLSQIFGHPIINHVANRSYELYLWQYPMMMLFGSYFAYSKLAFGLKLTIQLVTWLIVSEAFYQLKNYILKQPSRRLILVPFIGLAIIGFINSPDVQPAEPLTATLNTQQFVSQHYFKAKETILIKQKKQAEEIKKQQEALRLQQEAQNANSQIIYGIDLSKQFPMTSESIARFQKLPITFIGDSVFEMVRHDLKVYFPHLFMNAKVSRQVYTYVDVIDYMKKQGQISDTVVLSFGNNGDSNYSTIDTIMNQLKGKTIFVLSTSTPTSWEESINYKIMKLPEKYSNVYIIDWHAFAKERPQLFYRDAVHPNVKGAKVYARLIAYEISKVIK